MLWCILIFNMIAVDKNQTQICKLLYTLLLCVTSYCFRANCPGFLLSFGQKAVLRDVRIIRLSTRERGYFTCKIHKSSTPESVCFLNQKICAKKSGFVCLMMLFNIVEWICVCVWEGGSMKLCEQQKKIHL